MTITEADSNTLKVTSNAFKDGQYMPVDYTGFGKDMSPDFRLHNLSKKAVSIAIIMDDLDIPFLPAYNHWLIWNIPAGDTGKDSSRTGNPRPGKCQTGDCLWQKQIPRAETAGFYQKYAPVCIPYLCAGLFSGSDSCISEKGSY